MRKHLGSFSNCAGDHMRTKLLIICNDYKYFVSHRYKALLSERTLDADAIAMCGGMDGEQPRVLRIPVVPVACNRYRLSPVADTILVFQILWMLHVFHPDVVHTITLKPNLFGGLAVYLWNRWSAKPARLVMMSPGLGRVFQGSDSVMSRLRRHIVVRGLRIALANGIGKVLFENQEDSATWIRHGILKESQAFVISGAGVDAGEFTFQEEKVPCPPLRVLFASRLLRSKGTEIVIELAARLAERSVPVEFLIAGAHDGADSDSIDLSDRQLPTNVQYLGYRRDVPRLLTSVHAVILPTIYAEGLPRILLEAAAMRCALIATDIAGCRRIIEHGRSGFLLPVNNGSVDIDAAEAAIERLARQPQFCMQMGDEAHEMFWENGFDIESVRKQLGSALFPTGIDHLTSPSE